MTIVMENDVHPSSSFDFYSDSSRDVQFSQGRQRPRRGGGAGRDAMGAYWGEWMFFHRVEFEISNTVQEAICQTHSPMLAISRSSSIAMHLASDVPRRFDVRPSSEVSACGH